MMLWDELALRAFFEEQPAVHHALSETNPRHSTLTFTLPLALPLALARGRALTLILALARAVTRTRTRILTR